MEKDSSFIISYSQSIIPQSKQSIIIDDEKEIKLLVQNLILCTDVTHPIYRFPRRVPSLFSSSFRYVNQSCV